MAAITPGLESDVAPEATDVAPTQSGLGAAPASKEDLEHRLVEASHAGLVRFNWNRALIEDHLRKCKFWLEETKNGEVSIGIDPPLPRDLRPWKLMTPGARPGRFPLLGEGNSKMDCPTWDLPAGPPAVGGTCPAAAAGQTILPPMARLGQLDKARAHLRVLPSEVTAPIPFSETKAICAFCYAGEGNYDYTEIQAGLIVKYWWTRDLLATPEGYAEWVKIMAHAITRLGIPVAGDLHSDEKIKPVRIHSSGDFFSPRYAAAWMDVANEVAKVEPRIKFWAPTRTWASAGFMAAWPAILARLKQPNFVVRSSAYHVGDPAFGALIPGGPGTPGWARGTTSLQAPAGKAGPNAFAQAFPEAVWTGPDDPRRDHDCPVYALGPGQKSCSVASCRVCWTRPELRVQYTLH